MGDISCFWNFLCKSLGGDFALYAFFRILGKKSGTTHSFNVAKVWDLITFKVLRVGVKSYNFPFLIVSVFFIIMLTNTTGLLVFFPQNFIYKYSIMLLIIALSFWAYTYTPIVTNKKEKITLFIIGEMKFPTLSLLLSHIEILTHIFRPITLMARLWVNIWVGHLIIRGVSFAFCARGLKIRINSTLWIGVTQMGFFLFETGIMLLQTFVFTYLIKVYFEENFHHSRVTFKYFTHSLWNKKFNTVAIKNKC